MQNATTLLQIIRERGHRGLPLERVYRHLFNPQLYLLAYARLARNAGALTPGITAETADAMSLAKIERIITQVRAERYRWTPVRRMEIPKKNGQLRSLGIPTWSDKLLQEVIRLLLEAYYEPQFSPHSHGFRPQRGCHTALQDILHHGKGTKWFIEGDIKGCFDHIDHDILLDILRQRIHDNRFLRLIAHLLKAGYEQQWKYHPSLSGTPQGGIVSPLLANLYLDQLDQFVAQVLLPEYTRGLHRRRNPAWNRATSRVQTYRKEGRQAEAREWDQYRKNLPSCDTTDPHYRRLHYVRYADDFLLCFAGPKREAEVIRERLREFLQTHLKLELSAAKTLVTHATSQAARFLGYDLLSQRADTWRDNHGVRSANGMLALRVPYEVVQAACAKYQRRGKPTHRAELAGDSDYDIVRQYQWYYAGMVNYYRLAQNLWVLHKLRMVLETSLLRTLANKHKTSVGKLWRKHRSRRRTPEGWRRCVMITHPRPGREPLIAWFGGLSLRQQKRAVIRDKVLILSPVRTQLIQRLLAEMCEVCGAEEQVQVHHVRKLADLKKPGRKPLPDWAKIMIARQRKTLVLCQQCHWAVHNGSPLPQRQPLTKAVTGEPDDAKVSRPVRRGAVEKGAHRPPRQPPTQHY